MFLSRQQKISLLILFTSIFSSNAFAQTEQQKTESSTQTTATAPKWLNKLQDVSLGKGLSVETKDKTAKMSIHFRMQNLVEMQLNKDFQVAETDAHVKRLRLNLKGYFYSPKYTYELHLAFSPTDIEALPNGHLNIIRDAIIGYAPNSSWNFTFGQQKIKFNRAQITSSSALMFVDRSIVNSEFAIARDFGLFGKYSTTLGEKFGIVTNGALTMGEGPNFVSSSNSGLAYTAQVELYPLGKFEGGQFSEGCLVPESSPKIMIAGGYNYNDGAKRVAQEEDLIVGGQTRDLQHYFVDFIFKYQRFAFYTDWMARKCNNPLISENGEVVQSILTGNGVNVQTSYTFKKNWEIAARNSTIFPQDEVKSVIGYELYNQSTVGISKYIAGHKLKVQADASYNYKKGMARTEYNPFEIRLQVALGF